MTGFNGLAAINDVRLETNGVLNVLASTLEGEDASELAVVYVGGLSANDTLSIGNNDGSDAIVYAVNADGSSIVRTDKNAVVWSGASNELAGVNIFAIDDQQYVFDDIADRLSTNLVVSVVDGESVIGTSGDDAIFAGANDTVDGNGGNDQIYLTPSTIAPELDKFVDGNAEDNGLIVENGSSRVLLAGVNADAAIMIGDEAVSIGGDDTTSTEVVDNSTFVDSSADNIDVTLTGAKEGVIAVGATGEKILTAGDQNTTLENYSDDANVTLVGSARNDSIVAAGGNQFVDLSLGGRDTINMISGNVTVVGYDATTKSAFSGEGTVTFDANGFGNDNFNVKLEGDHSKGLFAVFIDNGNRQLYGWNDAETIIDASDFNQAAFIESSGWSTIIGGNKDDVIRATGGDVIKLSQGHDLITIDDRMKGDVTIDLGTHLSHTTVTSFDDDIVKVDDVNALKVKVTDYGMRLRAGNAFLTLEGVEDTVRVTDGESEFVLRTDYRDMLPDVDYVLEDADRIVRTPDGALEIDDDIFTFKGGNDIAINGFDDRWELRAGEGVDVERMTTLVNGTVKFTTNQGTVKLRK